MKAGTLKRGPSRKIPMMNEHERAEAVARASKLLDDIRAGEPGDYRDYETVMVFFKQMRTKAADQAKRHRDELIVGLYSVYLENGLSRSFRQIANSVSYVTGLATHWRTVGRALREAGAPIRRQHARTLEERVGTGLLLETAHRLDEKKISLKEAAKILGCSTSSASLWTRRVLNVTTLRPRLSETKIKEALSDLLIRGVSISASAKRLGMRTQELGQRMRRIHGQPLPMGAYR